LLQLFIADFKQNAPKLVSWAEIALPEGFTVFSFDEKLRKRLPTSNVVERLNKEILRRSSVATMLPNEASCLRLVTAVVMEISEDWIVSNRCWLSMNKEA